MSSRNGPPVPSIAPLAGSQIPQAVDVLARAFGNNAINRAVLRSDDPDRCVRSNRHSMRALLPVARVHGQALVATLDGVVVGGLVASPPGRFPLPPPALLSRLHGLARQGWQVTRRWGEVFEALAALHPAEPHWYLATLGVDPPIQGRGVGTALLSRWLDGVDRDGAPAYLETDNGRNIRFYKRAGFTPDGETSILGVRAWRLRRPPPARGRRNQ